MSIKYGDLEIHLEYLTKLVKVKTLVSVIIFSKLADFSTSWIPLHKTLKRVKIWRNMSDELLE